MNKSHPWLRLLVWKDTLTMRNAAFLMRRPHRSFRRTLRRDYVRSLRLPGYWRLTLQVWQVLWHNKRIFGLLILMYAVASLILGGITSQGTYQQISDMVNQSVGEIAQGAWATAGQAGLLLVAAFVTPGNLTPEQQIFLTLSGVLLWLCTVWLLRDILAGHRPHLRDGLYSSGSPIVASLVVLVVGVVQLLPVAIAALIYAGLTASGILTEGLGMMIFWTFAALIAVLTLYWMTPTFLALVIVTLPGMYPLKALRAAGDIVVGRRLRVLYRILWMFLMMIIGWAIVMIPIVLLDTGIKNVIPAIRNIPIVPVAVAMMSSFTSVWLSAYVYLLYRRIVDDDASPA